ncbi:Helix-destabilizing protein [Algoriella xinjiangensis]|uniref:single-stranded DNA-binding protein n=1 Tax=Algoriella xinjiangensis TaxID=684065 RepID=UPI000F63D815|nr:single-stranded DNA-binding protein [Algoriella xinjiangensis]VDH16883.1 Helix-destabilizing protein [Algoriella xinjiangensis]
MSLQKLELIGNIGADAKVHQFPDGKFAISFPLATSERWKDTEGNKQERTTWFECIRYAPKSAIAEYLKKGTQIRVEGRSSARAYIDKSGNAIAVLECIVTDFTFLSSAKNTNTPPAPTDLPPSVSGEFSNGDDDDLPF